jgi:hypothetical protein
MVICDAAPVPALPQSIVPGLAFANATKSSAERAGTEGCATSIDGKVATNATCARF